MKRIFRISIMLVLILALVTSSVQAVPSPRMLRQTESEEQKERCGSEKELPPGLRGKGIPPGLEKKDGLPPGLIEKINDLPTGIQMRFKDVLK